MGQALCRPTATAVSNLGIERGLFNGRVRGKKKRLTMWPADPVERRARQVVRVPVLGEDHLARVLVDAVVPVHEAQQREGQQRRDVGVVHEDLRAVAVDLEGEDVAVPAVVDDAVLQHGLAEVRAPLAQRRDEVLPAARGLDDVRRARQLHGHHGVGGDEEAQDGGVVAGPEGAADEARPGGQRVADAVEAERLGARGRQALEGVLVGDVAALRVERRLRLRVQHAQQRVQRRVPPVREELGGPGVLVELVAQQEEVGQRVELVLALEDERRLVRRVDGVVLAVGRRAQAAGRRRLEGVAVGRLDDILGLGVDGAEDERAQPVVVLRQGLVRRQLVRRVAQPLGVDVARHDERLRALPPGVAPLPALLRRGRRRAVDVPPDGRVQGVGEGIAEDLGQVLVDHARGDVLDDLLDGGGREGPACLRRPLERELQRSIAVWRAGRVSADNCSVIRHINGKVGLTA